MTPAALPSLIQAMLHPEFYPHPVKAPIQLIQTHISFVLLTGTYAYKIKKSVDFGFLDFSTLNKRKHFCEEELRMNERGAPGIYLEVLPISQDSCGSFQLASALHPVEYALKMNQFPQESLFISLFEKGLLTEELMEELGRKVADFHERAPRNDYISQFGEIKRIRESIDSNYQRTEPYIGRVQTLTQYQETRSYTDSFFANHPDLFVKRMHDKWIRECHGDLHLRNIALVANKIILFDCIEFNEPFRFVDVMYDIAFTVMDLEGKGRKDLGNAFLNTYIEQTGDWEGLQLLPLYLSRQAYVRAKVNSLMLDDPAIESGEKVQIEKVAAYYYQLAWNYTKTCQGKLILMSGLSGSGKSTVARYIARQLNAIQIRSDAVRKHLGGISLSQRGGPDLYTLEMTQKTYGKLLELGLKLAEQGFCVILDAKYDRINLRGDAIQAARSRQIPLQILYCTAPVDVLRTRLQQRRGDITDATVDLLESQQAAAEPFTEEEYEYLKVIDTTQELSGLEEI